MFLVPVVAVAVVGPGLGMPSMVAGRDPLRPTRTEPARRGTAPSAAVSFTCCSSSVLE